MEMLSAVCGLGIVNITTACVGKTCFNNISATGDL